MYVIAEFLEKESIVSAIQRMTMLGAVLATFGWFLWESGLIRKRDRTKPVPIVPPGSICLRVRCGTEQATKVAEVIQRSGALGIERRGEA